MQAQLAAAVACTSVDDDDRKLVERCRGGDRAAFTQLVVRYQRPVYNAAFWVLRRAEDASDEGSVCPSSVVRRPSSVVLLSVVRGPWSVVRRRGCRGCLRGPLANDGRRTTDDGQEDRLKEARKEAAKARRRPEALET